MSTRARHKTDAALSSLLERITKMPDPTLAIIFRNPQPKRSPVRNELCLLRRDGSSSQIHYSDQGEAGEETGRPTGFRRFKEPFS